MIPGTIHGRCCGVTGDATDTTNGANRRHRFNLYFILSPHRMIYDICPMGKVPSFLS